TQKCDNSDGRTLMLLRTGTNLLDEVIELFEEFDRQIPTLMKMKYKPKTGQFNNEIIYELQYSNHPQRTSVDVYNDWFEEIERSRN
ncbi:hypothetical protein, partial [Roseivirga sp.]|uniref:hypothetical protein n=1 Tax=Roseivirga sp. TaxID=1964215 RepID=UPI0023542BCE